MIIMTGVGTEEIAIEALHSGAADYLAKDRVSGASLNRAVKNSIEKACLQHSINDRNERLERANDELRRENDQIQRSRGLGLGLSIAREIVTLHGGEVQVESELGHGSVFRLVLPIEGAAGRALRRTSSGAVM